MMSSGRQVRDTIAAGLLVVAALGYAIEVGLGLLSGGFYPLSLGGTTRIAAPGLVLGLGLVVVLAAATAWLILGDRSHRLVAGGFGLLFVVALGDVVVLGPAVAIGVAITALVPAALVYAGRATKHG